MVGETQSEIELLDVVAFFYTFSLKEGSSIPSATRIQFLNTASLIFCTVLNISLKNPGARYIGSVQKMGIHGFRGALKSKRRQLFELIRDSLRM